MRRRNGPAKPTRAAYSKASLIAVIAAREAWADAGLRLNEPGAGVLVGSGAGGIDVAERQYFEFFSDGWKRVTPYAIPVSIVGMISSEISIALELHGISHVDLDRLHQLHRRDRLCGLADPRGRGGRDPLGRRGRLRHPGHDLRLLEDEGGGDALQRPAGDGVASVRRGATGSCSAKGRGWSCSSARIARARAARRVYATIDGYGSTCDAYHRVQMDPDGEQIVRAMQLAIDRSGRPIEEIGYVNFHGTSTRPQRRRRVAVRPAGAPAARRSRAGLVHQVDDRAPAGRERRRGHRDSGAGAGARVPAADHQSVRAGSGAATSTSSRTPAAQVDVAGRALQLPRVRIEEQRDGAWASSLAERLRVGAIA